MRFLSVPSFQSGFLLPLLLDRTDKKTHYFFEGKKLLVYRQNGNSEWMNLYIKHDVIEIHSKT